MPSAESLATCESRSRTSRSVPAASCLRKVLSYAARTVTAPARHGRDRDERPYEDGRLILRDSRRLAWRRWGHPTHPTVLRIQGTPGSRLHRHPDPTLWASARVRMLVVDRPGFGQSSRLPGRGIAPVADDLAAVLDSLGLERVPVLSFSGGGPHALALAATHPDRVSAVTVLAVASPGRCKSETT